MAERAMTLWYDREGDFLEVTFKVAAGYFTETADDRVMVKLDSEGSVLGFHILGLSTMQGDPLEISLEPVSKVGS